MIQRTTSVFMLLVLALTGIGALLPTSRAQTLRDEFEKTGMVPALVNQNARAIDNNAREIADLRRRADYIDNLHVETRIALIEKFITTQEENQKLFWGMFITLVVFVMKEVYLAFFKNRSQQIIQKP